MGLKEKSWVYLASTEPQPNTSALRRMRDTAREQFYNDQFIQLGAAYGNILSLLIGLGFVAGRSGKALFNQAKENRTNSKTLTEEQEKKVDEFLNDQLTKEDKNQVDKFLNKKEQESLKELLSGVELSPGANEGGKKRRKTKRRRTKRRRLTKRRRRTKRENEVIL